ncbi:hypothetical protein V6Z11_A08G119900 [Gossypium hirsutum]
MLETSKHFLALALESSNLRFTSSSILAALSGLCLSTSFSTTSFDFLRSVLSDSHFNFLMISSASRTLLKEAR